MRPERLQLALRPRSTWEAVELGTMLVRQHAGAVWRPWWALSAPVFGLVNLLFWWLDQVWLAGLVLWWWLPVFDRIPLYVLSRAVFGQAPGVMQTLRALPDWRRGRLVAHLLWRRLTPWRALGLPVDLLEDGTPAAKRARRRHIVAGQRGHGLLLAWLCVQFVLVLVLAVVLGVFLFVPGELVSESVQAVWANLVQVPPRWAQVALNAVCWLGLSVIEPFHIGAGFGLYLNHRVQMEGWDIELALRRLRARLGAGAGATLLAAGLLLSGWAAPAMAQAEPAAATSAAAGLWERWTLADVFGEATLVDAQAFIHAMEDAGQDPLLNQQRVRQIWIPRTVMEPIPRTPSRWSGYWETLIQHAAGVGEIALWSVLTGLVAVLLVTAPRWWPWMRRTRRHQRPVAFECSTTAWAEERALPPDLLASARALWRAGALRQALALLYRGSLATLAECGFPVPTSATEAECLRLSQRLPDPEQRAAFTQMVQIWQRAAYAGDYPSVADFDALSGVLAQRLRWRA